ncbi:MAG: flagellar hook capping FlgD N-terminal domain-containing protein [Bythopirellula sp.]|nr:flagellar hook capping FlgD N-terminal domain-containing protein [Bythopirellula sp.]
MSQINSLTNSLTGNKSVGNAINDLDVDDFLKLMIAELQNQDPLNPMENDQMLAQIGQMREIAASESLTQTLDSVLLGQNISSSTNLIGAEIDAISDDNQRVTGKVAKVSIAEGAPKLHIEERAGASLSDEDGNLAEGKYRYKIVWEASDGTLLGIETTTPVTVDADGKSVMLANLPETTKGKQIYRTKVGGEGQYHLVGSLNNGKTASFHDKTADEDLSGTVLSRTPRYVLNAGRSYEVSLSNVGEIRPPATTTPTPTPPATTTTTSTPDETDTAGTGDTET